MPSSRKKFGRIHYAGESPRDEAYGPIPIPNGAPPGIAMRAKFHLPTAEKNMGTPQKADDSSVFNTRKPVEIPQIRARIARLGDGANSVLERQTANPRSRSDAETAGTREHRQGNYGN
jgi:hypothetical protein